MICLYNAAVPEMRRGGIEQVPPWSLSHLGAQGSLGWRCHLYGGAG